MHAFGSFINPNRVAGTGLNGLSLEFKLKPRERAQKRPLGRLERGKGAEVL